MLRQPHNNHRASLIIGQSIPVRSPVPGARKKRLHFERLIFLMPLGAIVVIVYRLQACLPTLSVRHSKVLVPLSVLQPAAVFCCGVLPVLWRLRRGRRLNCPPQFRRQFHLRSQILLNYR